MATKDEITDKQIVKYLKDQGMRCNCDLDNWVPESSTGHTFVCRIHKRVQAYHRKDWMLPSDAVLSGD